MPPNVDQIKAINQEAKHYVGFGEVWLFGSRVDDAQCDGDVDFICAPLLPNPTLAVPMTRKIHSQAGFTLVELVVTLIIIGILAAFAAPRFFGTHGFEERGFHDETMSALRYAQKAAIAQRRLVRVTFADNKTVNLTIAKGNPAVTYTSLLSADGKAIAVDATADTKYRNADVKFFVFPAMITFDPLGRPNAAATITVSGFSPSITVEAETGYVH